MEDTPTRQIDWTRTGGKTHRVVIADRSDERDHTIWKDNFYVNDAWREWSLWSGLT